LYDAEINVLSCNIKSASLNERTEGTNCEESQSQIETGQKLRDLELKGEAEKAAADKCRVKLLATSRTIHKGKRKKRKRLLRGRKVLRLINIGVNPFMLKIQTGRNKAKEKCRVAALFFHPRGRK